MDVTLVRFSTLLRQRGIRISPPEMIDAARALGSTGLARRETVKVALQATLVKDARDLELFDELFEAFFTVAPLGDESGGDGDGETGSTTPVGADAQDAGEVEAGDGEFGEDDKERTELGQFFSEDEETGEQPAFDHGDGDAPGRGSEELMIGEADEDEGAQADLVIHLARVTDPGAPGDFNFDPGKMIDGDLVDGGLHAHELGDGSLLDEDEMAALRDGRGGGAIENLEEMLAAHLDKLRALPVPEQPALDPMVARYVTFTDEEERRMEALLVRTARDLHGALSYRKEVSPRGRLSSARTMRGAMRTGGLPFRPVTVDRMEDRPRLAVLVDVSLSVRNTARFTLHLVAGLQAMFGKVRTFAFVADLVEVTDLLRREQLTTALAMMFGGDVLDVDANSDYGRALRIFREGFLGGAVDRRTTVVILGDGRGNGNPPHVEALEAIARRARDVVWLTPEYEKHWPYGASDMEQYAGLCDRVEVVRDLDGLEAVAGNLLMPRRRAVR